MYTVSGWVNDGPSGRDLGGARVCAGMNCATSNAAGIYSLALPAGTVTLTASLEGYIAFQSVVRVVTNIDPYEGADIPMVPAMPEDDMRFVLTWDANPSDLDSHTFYGDEAQMCHACWYNQEAGYCRRSGEVTAVLERDFTAGFGPEVTYVRHVGHCTHEQKNRYCRLQFKVKDYSKYYEEPVGMGDSGAVVRVYKGSAQVAEYKIPRAVGGAWWWTVATVDLSNGNVFQGDANIEDPSNAFVGPAAEWVVPQGRYHLKTPANARVKRGTNTVTTLHRAEGASHPGWYTLRSGSLCLDQTGSWSDCPRVQLALEGLIYRTTCPGPVEYVRMSYATCKLLHTDSNGNFFQDQMNGIFGDVNPATMGDCGVVRCGEGRFRIGGSGACDGEIHLRSSTNDCSRAGGTPIADSFCQLSVCSGDAIGAHSYSLASEEQCEAEFAQGHFGVPVEGGEMDTILCSGAVAKVPKDQMWQLLPLAGAAKVQIRNVGINRCMQGEPGTDLEVTYCQFEDDEPCEEGRQWSRSNVPANQQWRVFPENEEVFL
jgi:hypothetical protein